MREKLQLRPGIPRLDPDVSVLVVVDESWGGVSVPPVPSAAPQRAPQPVLFVQDEDLHSHFIDAFKHYPAFSGIFQGGAATGDRPDGPPPLVPPLGEAAKEQRSQQMEDN